MYKGAYEHTITFLEETAKDRKEIPLVSKSFRLHKIHLNVSGSSSASNAEYASQCVERNVEHSRYIPV